MSVSFGPPVYANGVQKHIEDEFERHLSGYTDDSLPPPKYLDFTGEMTQNVLKKVVKAEKSRLDAGEAIEGDDISNLVKKTVDHHAKTVCQLITTDLRGKLAAANATIKQMTDAEMFKANNRTAMSSKRDAEQKADTKLLNDRVKELSDRNVFLSGELAKLKAGEATPEKHRANAAPPPRTDSEEAEDEDSDSSSDEDVSSDVGVASQPLPPRSSTRKQTKYLNKRFVRLQEGKWWTGTVVMEEANELRLRYDGKAGGVIWASGYNDPAQFRLLRSPTLVLDGVTTTIQAILADDGRRFLARRHATAAALNQQGDDVVMGEAPN